MQGVPSSVRVQQQASSLSLYEVTEKWRTKLRPRDKHGKVAHASALGAGERSVSQTSGRPAFQTMGSQTSVRQRLFSFSVGFLNFSLQDDLVNRFKNVSLDDAASTGSVSNCIAFGGRL